MAQVLKDELKIAIIESAKKEFLQKGYKNASMRSIASNANMTVGNLYRYFKSKEDINLYIVGPTYKKIDDAIKSLTKNGISMETRVFNLKPDTKELKSLFDEFAEKLVDIYWSSKTEFNILMLHSRLSNQMIEWFAEIINSLISSSFVMEGINSQRDTLALAYAQSCFAGLQTLFKNSDTDIDELKVLIKTFLRSFVFMLDNDLNRYVAD